MIISNITKLELVTKKIKYFHLLADQRFKGDYILYYYQSEVIEECEIENDYQCAMPPFI